MHFAQEDAFSSKMKNFFHSDAFNPIRIQEDSEFLLVQKEPKRRNYMESVQMTLVAKEMRGASGLTGTGSKKERQMTHPQVQC